MNREEVIEKVKKILALAENNPNENEAISAALKAQKLMADWDIDSSDISDQEILTEDIIESNITLPRGRKQMLILATILAKAFRCHPILKDDKILIFVGYQSDIVICEKTFSFLSKEMEKLSKKYVNEQRKKYSSVAGLKESYQYGFLTELQKQLEKQSRELMIVMSKEVKEKVSEMFPNTYVKRINEMVGKDSSAVHKGSIDARSLYESGFVEGEDVKKLC